VSDPQGRSVPAVHGTRPITPDAPFERALSDYLRARHDARALTDLYGRFVHGEAEFDALMRRVLLRALARSVGDDVRVGRGVLFRHPETFEIGSGVFLGEQTMIQGRVDGTCRIGDRVWIAYIAQQRVELLLELFPDDAGHLGEAGGSGGAHQGFGAFPDADLLGGSHELLGRPRARDALRPPASLRLADVRVKRQ